MEPFLCPRPPFPVELRTAPPDVAFNGCAMAGSVAAANPGSGWRWRYCWSYSLVCRSFR